MKVLICEDDEQLAKMLKTTLEGKGIEAVVAGNMREAKALLDDTIGAVTMDGQMPLMDGMPATCTDMLVEDILKHRPDLVGKIFALAGRYDLRDRLLLAGAIGVPGRRGEDRAGTIKPYFYPVIDKLVDLAQNP